MNLASALPVARLLDAARSSGVVKIEIADPGGIDVELSRRLQEAFGLRHAVVVPRADENPTTLWQRLGTAAAELLAEIVTDEDVLGLAWSRSVSAMTNALTELPTIPVVQLTGALVQPDAGDRLHRPGSPRRPPVRRRRPLLLRPYGRTGPSNWTRSAKAARSRADLWAVQFSHQGRRRRRPLGPGESTVHDVIEGKVRRELSRQGVCGEIAGVLFDADGHPVESDLTERMISVSAAQLRAIPEVIALAYGTARSPAVQAAIRGGFINSVVTHPSLARALVAHQENQP